MRSPINNQPTKKLALKKESVRVLTQGQSVLWEPTNDCTEWTC